ncbi:succinate dehydrogenase cytochrome b subunit [Ornithinimicrobium sediminis]|uniref:succinate dehydrogenase cytochrome b subunit n=1 Tax=Ornithinimicrobium sediminis TaxID=2904603 RepID=UPI001E48A58D|nr:succinate dehydrogenase cytochrome b subunit [Ornithinimicrobium sediminis]
MATSTISTGERRGASSILLKSVMAITGLIFVGFILAHMYGNLMIFAGEEAFDEYAEHLRELLTPMLPYGGALWILRIVLLASLVGHAYAAFALWSRAGKARKSRYAVSGVAKSLFVSKAMRWGGVALLLFLVFHILHFTTNTIQINGDFDSPAARLVSSFEVWWAVGIYTLAVLALGMHLLHGVWGAGMTLGLNTSIAAAERLRIAAVLIAVVTVVGFLLPPFAILFGIIP